MTTTDELQGFVDELLSRVPGRCVLGIVGPPASGKSTLAACVVADVNERFGDGFAIALPMDGFHLANQVLVALGRRDRKGSPDTFDVGGFTALLDRVRTETAHAVYAPEFHREIEESFANAIRIEPSVRLVVVEGNWLLFGFRGWQHVRSRLDESWYLEVLGSVREARLLERHQPTYGDAAAAWVAEVDGPNSALVESTRTLADRILVGAIA
jgi:pantothenate kinase